MGGNNDIPVFDDAAGKPELSESKLMAYLEGRLSAEEQHEVEQWLTEEGMESDAIEGLKALPAEDTRQSVGRLNMNLRKAVRKKKERRTKLKTDQLTWTAIIIVLLLVVIAYIIVRKAM